MVKEGAESRGTLYVGLGGRLTNCSWCKNLYYLSISRMEKIILAAFMGNLILNLHSLDHKGAAWLAGFRCCANYSTAIYYRFSFVLCCSDLHQTVVETGLFFSESVQECLCAVKVLQSLKRTMLLSVKLLWSLSHPWDRLSTDLAPLNAVSALDWRLRKEGSVDCAYHPMCLWWGFFCSVFSW